MKTYLGDSVYIREGDYFGEFILTTENGVEIDNEIYIDLDILECINLFVKKTIKNYKKL